MVVGEPPDDLGLIEQLDATLNQGLLHLLYLLEEPVGQAFIAQGPQPLKGGLFESSGRRSAVPGPTPHYPPEFKREAVELYRSSEKSIPNVAQELGIADESLRRWIRQH
jgi:Transposase